MQPDRADLRGTRVLLVGDWPPPMGGVAVHVQSLREASRKAGARVTVLDIGKGQNVADGVVASGGEARFAAALFGLAGVHDLIHLHTSGANAKSWLLVGLVALAARTTGRRAIVTFHSGHGPRYLSTAPRALAARAALAGYDRVVCVNQEISRALTRLGCATGRHLVAPAFGQEGVVPGVLPPKVAEFRSAFPHVVSAMLAPGRDYGARELFAAVGLVQRAMPDVGVVVYGAGTEKAELRLLARELGANQVLYLGPIDRGSALAVMKASDVFVRPTLVDGDAVSVREALAVGTRVVATRVGTRPPETILCAPASETDLARALENTLSGAIDLNAAVALAAPVRDGIESVLDLYAKLSPGSGSALAA